MRLFKLLICVSFILGISTLLFAQPIPGRLTIEEEDGSPSGAYWKIKVSNGTLTENSDYSGSVTTGGGSGSPGGSDTQIQYNSGGAFAGNANMTFNATTGVTTLNNLTLTTPLAIASGGTGAANLNDLIALGANTTGNYAAGDAEAGAALTGDSATSFFSSGTIEDARLPTSMADKVITGSLAVPQGTNPTVDAAGEIAVDTTDDQLVYGATPRVIPYYWRGSGFIENLTASDNQNVSLGDFPYNVTITGVSCKYGGTTAPATVANITLAYQNGTLMTHSAVTCVNQTTASTWVAVTSNNTLASGNDLFYNVTNTPTTGYNYRISYKYTVDRQ